MFFFLTLKQPPTRPDEIEPDILPGPSLPTKTSLASTTASFGSWLTTWDFSDRTGVSRKLACVLAWGCHVPGNVISVMSRGVHLLVFVWVLLSLLNLVCVGGALWRLDVMRGERLFYTKIYNRKHFDYVILGLLVVYAASFAVFLFVQMSFHHWVTVLRIVWPCLIAADLFCFVAGWVSSWRDVSDAPFR